MDINFLYTFGQLLSRYRLLARGDLFTACKSVGIHYFFYFSHSVLKIPRAKTLS